MRKFLLLLSLICASFCYAQLKPNTTYQQYVDQYSQAAIDQMHKYKIPASITLAQALLESGAGKSFLAVNANNHFGIKVGVNWSGPYVLRDDDRKGEKFRKYKNVSESYEDHSLFLQQPRYKSLFNLDPLDYKAWARGLKACGYATNPVYADRLITIIETYDLSQYDEDRWGTKRRRQQVDYYVAPVRHAKKMVNGIECVTGRKGDTWDALAKELKVSKKKLLKFNECDESMVIYEGMNIFLMKKAKKAESKYKGTWHKVQSGESMYSVAQFYGVRLKNLYKMNFKDADYVPVQGDLLKVR